MSKFEETYESLTMKELTIIEQKAGMGIGTLGEPEAPKAAMFTAMAWVIKKREQADFSFADAENLTQGEVNRILGLDEDEAPKAEQN